MSYETSPEYDAFTEAYGYDRANEILDKLTKSARSGMQIPESILSAKATLQFRGRPVVNMVPLELFEVIDALMFQVKMLSESQRRQLSDLFPDKVEP